MLRERLASELEHPFNSVLANRYRSGADAMGWHADDEPELGPEPLIASVSLGATRRFLLRHRHDPARRLSLDLEPGSLLCMSHASQLTHEHGIPKTKKPQGPRISAVFEVRPM